MAFADLAETRNQVGVANAIESLPNTNPLYRFIETLPSGEPATAFNSLSGDSHASWQSGLKALSARAAGLGAQRMHSNLTAGYRPGAAIAQSDGPLPASAWPTSKALPAWAEVVGHRQSVDGDGNAAKLTQNVYGLFVGADEQVGSNGWRVGGSLGFTTADAKVKARDASADTKSYSASVYTGKGFSHGMHRVNVMGGLAYTHHRISSERSVAGLGQNLKAKYNANTLQLFGEVGYAMGQYSKQGVEPFAGINIMQQRVGSFQETGGFAALRGSSTNDTTTSTTLGVRAHSDFKLAGKDARLKGTVGWRHAFGDVKQTATMAFEGSSSFTVTGAPLARNTALVGLQAEVELSRRAALELGYQGEYASGSREHAVNVKMRWAY
jgi:outer membrane autotransporter protein